VTQAEWILQELRAARKSLELQEAIVRQAEAQVAKLHVKEAMLAGFLTNDGEAAQ